MVQKALRLETEVLDSLFTTLHKDQMHSEQMGEKGCNAIIAATSRHLQDVFDTDPIFKTVALTALKVQGFTGVEMFGRKKDE